MPAYLNSTSADIVTEGMRFPAKETLLVDKVLRTLPAGLTKTAADPNDDAAAVVSETLSGDTADEEIVAIPAVNSSYSFRAFCTAGSAKVMTNANDRTKFVLLTKGKGMEMYVDPDLVEKFYVIFAEDTSSVQVDVIQGSRVKLFNAPVAT